MASLQKRGNIWWVYYYAPRKQGSNYVFDSNGRLVKELKGKSLGTKQKVEACRLKKEFEHELIATEHKILEERRYLLAMFELEQRQKQGFEFDPAPDDPDINPATGLTWGLTYNNERVVVEDNDRTDFEIERDMNKDIASQQAQDARRRAEEATRQAAEALKSDPLWEGLWDKISQVLPPTASSNYRKGLKSHWKGLTDFAQPVRASDVTVVVARKYILDLQKKGRRTNSIVNYHIQLKKIFDVAIEFGIIQGPNPFSFKKIKVIHHPAKEALTAEQLLAMTEAAADEDINFRVFLFLGAYAGLRRSEITNLRWEDIDFQHKLINIRTKIADPEKGIKAWKPKTQERVVPMHGLVKDLLESIPEKSGYIFRPGEYFDRNQFNPECLKEWKAICVAANVKCNAHKLRHTFGSLHAVKGTNPWVVKKWMGHADLKTTQGYVHMQDYDQAIDGI